MAEASKEHFDPELLEHIRYYRNDEAIKMLTEDLAKAYYGGSTLLHHVVETLLADPVSRELIRLGADVDSLDKNGKTPLMRAVECSSGFHVFVLLEAGANWDIVNAEGQSILHMAFNPVYSCSHVLQRFINRMRAITSTTNEFVEKLVEAGCTIRDAVDADDLELAKLLIGRGHIDGFKKMIDNSVFCAASNGNAAIIELLLEKGADPNWENSSAGTPLHVLTHVAAVDQDEKYNDCAVLLFQAGGRIFTTSILPLVIVDNAMSMMNPKLRDIFVSHLAMIETLDTLDAERMKLYTQPKKRPFRRYVMYWNECRQILKTVLFGNLNLLDLLTMSDCKMRVQIRKETFISEVEKASSNYYLNQLYPYYHTTLMKRIAKCSQCVELEDKSITILCEIMNGNYQEYYIAAKIIVAYLSMKDLEHLCEVYVQ